MTKTTMPLTEALPIASELLDRLNYGYDNVTGIAIAGSIRRQKPEVGDIEIVARTDATGLTSADDLLAQGVLTKRHAWGNRYKAGVYKGMNVDLFVCLPDRQWGCTLWLRTGSGDANKLLVTQRAKGGLLPDDMLFNQEQFWRLNTPVPALERKLGAKGWERLKDKGDWSAYGGVILPTPEEADVFALAGLPFVEPPLRTPEHYRSLARSQSSLLSDAGAAQPVATPRTSVESTAIAGVFDHVDLLAPTELSADTARVREQYIAACAALLASHDLDELGKLWYAAYESGRLLSYASTRELLAVRRTVLEADQARKKAERQHHL